MLAAVFKRSGVLAMVVIGAGPAGMMHAMLFSAAGAEVILAINAGSARPSTATRIWTSRWAPRRLQRMGCFLAMRRPITRLTIDSTTAVEMRWPEQVPPGVVDQAGGIGP
jgi:NADPH-dependent 2,4-dienoyl-CoA reductase/sulfur reductase-like enzyme